MARAASPGRRRSHGNALDTVDFATGDVLDLELPDASFDAVHAHQVLQHVGDPIAALHEMRRLCRPARDAGYGVRLVSRRSDPGRVARSLPSCRDAQRRRAGRGPAAAALGAHRRLRRAHAGRIRVVLRHPTGRGVEQAVESGLSTQERLQEISRAWQRWSEAEDGWFLVPHGELLCRP